MKVSGSKYKFLVLYVDDILLVSNDIDMLLKTKKLLFSHFDMKCETREKRIFSKRSEFVILIGTIHAKP